MLNVYVKREDIGNSVEIIDDNNTLFNYDLYSNMTISNLIQGIMRSIDKAEYTEGINMRSKYGNVISMEHLSTGCKTVINIINHPELVINCVECGDNVLHKILKNIQNGNVLFEIIPSNEKMDINANVITNQGIYNVTNVNDFINLVDKYLA